MGQGIHTGICGHRGREADRKTRIEKDVYKRQQVDKGRSSKFTDLYYPICKYIYVPICVLVLILGIVLGGIG